jgi:hypothetical protein
MRSVPRFLGLVAGMALAAPALAAGHLDAQAILGRYALRAPDGAVVALTIETAGNARVKGSLAGNGVQLTLEGEIEEGNVTGMLRGNGGAAVFEAELEGEQLTVVLIELGANGQPNFASARELVFQRDNSTQQQGSVGAASPGGAPSGVAGSGPQDQQLAQFLMANAWCSFSFSGSSNYSSGSTRTTRVVFGANGVAQQTSGSEGGSSGAAGSVYGSSSGATAGRWRINDGALQLSADGAAWQPVKLEITRNSNGSPIVKADGTEYMVCR